MTEEAWRNGRMPAKLLDQVEGCGRAGARRLHLFAAACCRAVEHLFYDPCQTAAVVVLERHADGLASAGELAAAHEAVLGMGNFDPPRPHVQTAELDARYMAVSVVRQAARPASPDGGVEVLTSRAQVLCTVVQGVAERLYTLTGGPYQSYQGRKRLCHLVRCLFDNPFRPVVFDAKWRTEPAVALATGIYEERAFDRLPILADALEEAGCDHADVLSHCRGPGLHARGCWVVDGVLGKV
jgi:hypothetical protein